MGPCGDILQGPSQKGGLKRLITRMEILNWHTSAPELPLGGFMPNDDPVQIRNIDGLGPVAAAISSSPFATGRGELYQGASTGKRNIVLTLGLNPNWNDQTISSLRQLLYKYLLPEQWTRLRFFSDDLPTVEIAGVVETFEPNIFSQDPEIQISILCPKPDFVDVDATFLAGTVGDGSTELEIDYIGTVFTGFEFRVRSSTALAEYSGNFIIRNQHANGDQAFQVLSVTVNPDMYFSLNSVRSDRWIRNVFVDDAMNLSVDILAKMATNSIWPELRPGENLFSVEADAPGQKWVLAYFNRFGGL